MADVRGGFDILFDNISQILSDYADTEAAIDSGRDYTVYKDYYRYYNSQGPGAYMYLAMGNISPDAGRSGAYVHYAYDVTYTIDLVVEAAGSKGDTYTRADEAAGARLRYLIQQALDALYGADIDYNMPDGSVRSKPLLRVEPLPPEMQMGERPIVGARLSLDVGLAWEPGRMSGTDLEQIYVDAGKWQALYDYT